MNRKLKKVNMQALEMQYFLHTRGLEQKDLAPVMDVVEPTVSEYVNGNIRPPKKRVERSLNFLQDLERNGDIPLGSVEEWRSLLKKYGWRGNDDNGDEQQAA